MKRIIPFVLIFALLTACGTPASEPSPTPSAAPVETPQSTPAPTPALHEDLTLEHLPYEPDQPDYIPPMDFMPVSVWQAEPFGDNGKALLYLGEERNGTIPFKVFSAFSYDVWPLDGSDLYSCRAFSGQIGSDKSLDISCEQVSGCFFEPVLALKRLEGTAQVDKDTINLSYQQYEVADWAKNAGITVELRSSGAKIDVGDNTLDSIQYLPGEFFRLPDEDLYRAMYWMPVFEEEIIKTDTVRGLSVGDTYSDILERIPDGTMMRDPRSIIAPMWWYQQLYGNEFSSFKALLNYDIKPTDVIIGAKSSAVFYIDDDLVIDEIRIINYLLD